MNKKDIGEIKRRFNLEHNNITCIRGCYVNNQGEVIALGEDYVVKYHTLSFEGTSYIADNCSVVAIVSDPNTHEVINCIEVEL